MKKFVVASLMAILIACASQHQASAWINSKFGIGMNWSYASGGNSFGYGLIRNGQPGGPEFFHSHTAVPAYPQPGCCVTQPAAPIVPAPQVHCPAGAAAQPVAAPANASQSLRPVYPYRYPTNYYRGY